MTRRSPVRLLSGAAFLVLLSSCAGSGHGVNPAADAAAAASASTTDAAPGDVTGTDHGNPGAPGGDPAGGGGGGGGGGGAPRGNPGAPGDVAVFEEGGNAPYSALVGDAATKCADRACTLKEPPIVLDGHVDRVPGGVGDCTIADKTDILYDPPAQGGRFPKGATVRAQVHCADVETPVDNGNSPAGGSPEGQDPANPDAGNSAGDTTSGSSDQPQG